jgi:hypothetical protein
MIAVDAEAKVIFWTILFNDTNNDLVGVLGIFKDATNGFSASLSICAFGETTDRNEDAS